MSDRGRRSGLQLRYKIALLFLALITAVWLFGEHFSRTVQKVAYHQILRTATELCNHGVEEGLESPLARQNFVLETTGQEDWKTMQINTVAVNQLHVHLKGILLEELGALEHQRVTLPLGMLLGNPWFSTLGPEIPCRMLVTGTLSTQIESIWEEAGINQVRHGLWLHITLDLHGLLPFGSVSCQVQTQYPVTEQLMRGEIPESYAEIVSSDRQALSSDT